MYKTSIIFAVVFSFFFVTLSSVGAQDIQDVSEQIRKLEEQIDFYSREIQRKQNEAQSLSQQISLLDFQVKQAQLEIDATNLAIRRLVSSIQKKGKDITQRQLEIEHQQALLGEYLRQAQRSDAKTLFELILKNNRFSDFFNDLNYITNIQAKIQDTVAVIKSLKEKLIVEKAELEDNQAEQEQLKVIQKRQKSKLEASKRAKQKLLTETKGKESLYQKLLVKARADIEAIKKQAYNLALGFKMTFEKALSYALPAAQRTGVRPAFLLAIVKIESDWGGNVGKGNWRRDMHPRDWNAFQRITAALGLNPDTTPVSRKPAYGWGGAMGPAQFIPTTWLLYASAVSNLTGNVPPSPWNIEDAFTAAGLILAESGATAKNYQAEHKSARMYIAGSRWNRSLTARLYANAVLNEAAKIQRDIDILNQGR